MTRELIVSNSELNEFKRCKRRWTFNYYLGYGPPELHIALSTGTLWHLMMEEYYRAESAEAGLDAAAELLVRARIKHYDDRIDYDMLGSMMHHYNEWLEHSGVDQGWKFTHIESVAQMELMPGVTLRGKIDVLAEDIERGEWGIIDHKSDGSSDFDCLKNPLINQQVKTYMLLCANDPSVPTVQRALYNVARKVKDYSKATPPYFAREDFYVNKSMLESHRKELVKTAEEMVRFIEGIEAEGDEPVLPASVQPDCKHCPWQVPCGLVGDEDGDWKFSLENKFNRRDPNARYNEEEVV